MGRGNRDMTRISLEIRAVTTTLNFAFYTRGREIMSKAWKQMIVAIMAWFLSSAAVASAQNQPPSFETFAAYTADSETRIDYQVWSEMLGAITFDVGMSDRYVPRGRIIETGSRITGQSTSRYRTESNRVIFHLLEDFHKEAISSYRQDLEALPDNMPLSNLGRNEQLAYWINLHNVIVIDEIAKRYPLRNVDRIRLDDGGSLYEGHVTTIQGVPLSLNDIRLNIVARYWDNPVVLYGFFSGAVSSPSLQARAYTGTNVMRLLNRNAEEYVNALRGVENSAPPLRVSPIYFEAQHMFPNWPQDLIAHLDSFADDDVAELLDDADRVVRNQYDWNVADLTNGAGPCGGGVRRNVQEVAGTSSGSAGAAASLGGCNPVPPVTRDFIVDIQERRLRLLRSGQLGRVIVTDIATEDSDHSRSGGAQGQLVDRDDNQPEGR